MSDRAFLALVILAGVIAATILWNVAQLIRGVPVPS